MLCVVYSIRTLLQTGGGAQSRRPTILRLLPHAIEGGPKKTDTQFYFWDNFSNSAPILTILLLLQAEIYGA